MIKDAFGSFYIEALDALRDVELKNFEDFLISLNSVYMRIITEMEVLL